jgi:hypothetical protein
LYQNAQNTLFVKILMADCHLEWVYTHLEANDARSAAVFNIRIDVKVTDGTSVRRRDGKRSPMLSVSDVKKMGLDEIPKLRKGRCRAHRVLACDEGSSA